MATPTDERVVGEAVMRRVSVVGNAGAGKTRFAQRLSAEIGAPWVELDAIHHLADWEPIDPATF
jgi:adenylate kinase family enzyme